MKACFKVAMLPTFLTAWWACQGLGFIDWKIAWAWGAGMLVGVWVFWSGVIHAIFPNLKLSNQGRVIAKMNDDLTESDPYMAGEK